MIEKIYRYVFWAGYFAVLFTAVIPIIGNLDKIRIGYDIFSIRLDHLLHIAAYFLICMYYLAGQMKGLTLFRSNSLTRFISLIVFLAVITEIMQIRVPARSFNVMDIVANLAGIALGVLVIYLTITKLTRSKKLMQ